MKRGDASTRKRLTASRRSAWISAKSCEAATRCQADADLRGGTVEPARRIRLRDLIGDGDRLVEMLVEEIEDRSVSGEGPDESWRAWDETAVHAREGAGPALEAWLERWVIVDQFEPVPNPEKSTGEAPGGCA